MGTTSQGLRYPESTVLANTLHTQIKNLADDVDAKIFDTGWQIPTLGSPWVQYGSGWETRYRRKNGRVEIKGLLAATSQPATANPIFTLPVGYRPSSTIMVNNTDAGAVVRHMYIQPTGVVYVPGGIGNISWYCMTCTFIADQ